MDYWRIIHLLCIFYLSAGIGATLPYIIRAYASKDVRFQMFALTEAAANETRILLPGMAATGITGAFWGLAEDYNFFTTGWLAALTLVYIVTLFVFLPLMGFGLRRARLYSLRAVKKNEITDELLFETVASAERPVVIHCVGGKDRAGMTSALLLLTAGVDEDTVIEDYALTAQLLPQPAEERIQLFIDQFGLTRETYLAMWQAEPGSMKRTLAVLNEEFGGIDAYVASIGVDDHLRERFLGRFLAAER